MRRIGHELEVLGMELMYDGWDKVYKTRNRLHYEGGEISEEFEIDIVYRRCKDAVVVVPYKVEGDKVWVYLVSCYRPAREHGRYETFPEEMGSGNTWELPAGGVEESEVMEGIKGYKAAGVRELREEAGLEAGVDGMVFLGKRVFSSTGMERLFFLAVDVGEEKWVMGGGDGHPLERGMEVEKIELGEALRQIELGYITDAKTEIGLNRLQKKLTKDKK